MQDGGCSLSLWGSTNERREAHLCWVCHSCLAHLKPTDQHTTAMSTRSKCSRRSLSKLSARLGTDTHPLRQKRALDSSRQFMQSSRHLEFFQTHKAISLSQKTSISTNPFLVPRQLCPMKTSQNTTRILLSRRKTLRISISHEFLLWSIMHLLRQ